MASVEGFPLARAVTRPPGHHFFGYYDKLPWDVTGRYLLALETSFIDRPPTTDDRTVIGRVDLAEGCRWEPLAETSAWNWQQGTMLHWLATAPDRLIIHNDVEGGQFVSVIRDVHTGEKRTLPRPIYALAPDGRSAVTLNFARVHRHRPGYGYVGVDDPWADEPAPERDGVYWMDLETGDSRLIISLAQIVATEPQPSMAGTSHWVNHLQFNTDGSRFLFLHRWGVIGKRWGTRMFTADPDGGDVCCLNPDEMTSHFDWRDRDHVLAWAHQHDVGDRYFLFGDHHTGREIVGEDVLTCDGHCSYSPDRRWILTDTYPDAERKRTLILYRPEDEQRIDVGRFYAPPELDGEIRCDLHPRWSRDGRQVCFDSVHEGHRQIYVIDVGEVIDNA